MTTSPQHRILESKRGLRWELASMPVAAKLRILEVMREREIAIRGQARSENAQILIDESLGRR